MTTKRRCEHERLVARAILAEKLERGLAQFERGEYFTAEESRADLEKRKLAWLAERGPR